MALEKCQNLRLANSFSTTNELPCECWQKALKNQILSLSSTINISFSPLYSKIDGPFEQVKYCAGSIFGTQAVLTQLVSDLC